MGAINSYFADVLLYGVLASTLTLIIVGAAALAGYVYIGYILMCMGRKAGNPTNKNWMAFIPFAKDIYYLKMVRRPWWQMFFFGATGYTVAGIVFLLITIISSGATTAAAIIMGIYSACVVVFSMLVKAEVYHGFGFNKWIVLAGFPWLDMMIAFSTRISYENNAGDERAKPKNGKLVGISGTYAGQIFELSSDAPIIIGRDPSQCNLVFSENREDISRRHCEISYYENDNAYGVVDCSKNGTYVNGERIPSDIERICRAGTIVSLGGQKDSFRLG